MSILQKRKKNVEEEISKATSMKLELFIHSSKPISVLIFLKYILPLNIKHH